jgi:hypothetical protein
MTRRFGMRPVLADDSRRFLNGGVSLMHVALTAATATAATTATEGRRAMTLVYVCLEPSMLPGLPLRFREQKR